MTALLRVSRIIDAITEGIGKIVMWLILGVSPKKLDFHSSMNLHRMLYRNPLGSKLVKFVKTFNRSINFFKWK